MADLNAEVVVIGAGPGGYTAAFRAADLGKKVVLVERYKSLGGVCLNVGCIPSKALLKKAALIREVLESEKNGVAFGKPKIDIDKLRTFKEGVIGQLTTGLSGLAKQRKVTVVTGVAKFASNKSLTVQTEKGPETITFENCIIAAGSMPVKLPFLPDDERIIDSTGALELKDIPNEMLVIGGGIIGMEMATVYSALGTNISVVELTKGILPGVDADLVKPLEKKMKPEFKSIMTETSVTKVEAKKDGLYVTFEGKNAPSDPVRFDKILSSVGRIPNGKTLDCEKAGINVDERGFIAVDKSQRTNVANIYAIGDICGNPMLAHKAIPEGVVAAEVIAGKKRQFEPKVIPNVAYTNPEVAWVGLTEAKAKEQNIDYGKGVFPWAANGRAISQSRTEGLTKILFDKKTNLVIGAGIVGPHAGDLISELALAIEMGCEAEDLALTIHPHPTLAETIAQASEVYEGTATDVYAPKK